MPGRVVGARRPRAMDDVPRVGLFFRGTVGRNLRLCVRGVAPRTLLNEGGRGAILRGAAVGLVASYCRYVIGFAPTTDRIGVCTA